MLETLGCAFLGLAGFIFWKQKKATTCELHDRTAGHIALVLAVLVAIVGGSLIVVSAVL